VHVVWERRELGEHLFDVGIQKCEVGQRYQRRFVFWVCPGPFPALHGGSRAADFLMGGRIGDGRRGVHSIADPAGLGSSRLQHRQVVISQHHLLARPTGTADDTALCGVEVMSEHLDGDFGEAVERAEWIETAAGRQRLLPGHTLSCRRCRPAGCGRTLTKPVVMGQTQGV
jgi:hypothetical protein